MAKPIVKKTLPATTPKPSSSVPAYIKQGPARGAETVLTKDLIIPRLDLMQDLNPQVQEGMVEAGEFWHTILEESYGSEVVIVPVLAEVRYMLWRPRWDGGGILARADDGIHWSPSNASFEVRPYKDSKKKVKWKTAPTVEASGLANWGSMDPDEKDSPPAANKMATLLAYTPDKPSQLPVVVSMQRGSLTVGAKFLSRIKFGGTDIFAVRYKMQSTPATNSEGQKYWSYKFVSDGYVDENTYKTCERMYNSLRASGYKIKDEEQLQGEEPTDSDLRKDV